MTTFFWAIISMKWSIRMRVIWMWVWIMMRWYFISSINFRRLMVIWTIGRVTIRVWTVRGIYER
jgi:hypothetical protein